MTREYFSKKNVRLPSSSSCLPPVPAHPCLLTSQILAGTLPKIVPTDVVQILRFPTPESGNSQKGQGPSRRRPHHRSPPISERRLNLPGVVRPARDGSRPVFPRSISPTKETVPRFVGSFLGNRRDSEPRDPFCLRFGRKGWGFVTTTRCPFKKRFKFMTCLCSTVTVSI